MIEKDIERIYFSKEEIQKRVQELGAEISRDYADKDPILVGVLKGCFVFMADLTRCIDAYAEIDFMAVSTYGNGTTTTGAVNIRKDLSYDIENRHVIIIEDILDSGVTLSYLRNYLMNRKPASIKICTLLDKPARRKADISADYVGFECPNEFIVGYGLDYAEKYRNLDYIGVLKPEIYQ
ncbi:MAG: hypoxanthine phosphoribosyltransferase [Oscillospiraceae bacterium]|nr:hypoxanthine phosphoribosyltransferase [Oscillospiraceae bacterium]